MPFLSRRSVDPLTPSPPPKDKAYVLQQSSLPRSRARSDASLLRRVSTLFASRRRTSKTSFTQTNASSVGIGHICTLPRGALPRVSSDSSPPSSLEIRRPSGLGRRASLLGSDHSFADSRSAESDRQAGQPALRAAAPTGYASLPNLLGGAVFYAPDRACMPPYHGLAPVRRPVPSFALPDPLFRVVLEYLPRHDLAAVARVSRGFCTAARYALYHALDVRTLGESTLETLFGVLAHHSSLAALVVSFSCHAWPSWELAAPDGQVTSVPADDVRAALQRMHNLKSLALPSLASLVDHTPSFSFSLAQLTVLDRELTCTQLATLCGWLPTQPSLESLAFPHLAAYARTDDGTDANLLPVCAPLLPALQSLHVSTAIVSALCGAIQGPLAHLTLDVRETLYTGLRPSAVMRALHGVRAMHVVFGPDVDKRTVEKFLGAVGSMLTGDRPDALHTLEVEVRWADDDAAEMLYGIVTSVIGRCRGLATLKLTSPCRSVQAPVRGLHLARLPPPPPSPVTSLGWTTPPSIWATPMSLRDDALLKELVIERGYAKTWTQHCPSLSDIRFDYACAAEEVEVELCAVWFRRKMRS